MLTVLMLSLAASAAPGSPGSPQTALTDPADRNRIIPIRTLLPRPATLQATFRNGNTQGGYRGTCPPINVSRTDSTWGPGQYILQAGFEEGEILAASYDVDPSEFPIRLDLAEVLFGTSSATVQTTTHWSVLVWDGTPSDGALVASYSSDGLILPHLVMPPGTSGTIIQVSIDPDDPDQIYIYNDSGTNTFSVGFRVDQLNSPGTPCLLPPAEQQNAFPVTDTSGLDWPSDNWISMVDGLFCACGTGWSTFQQLPGACTPSGDWVLRATYTPVECSNDPGACCIDADCYEFTASECDSWGGEFQGSGTSCGSSTCGDGVGACCIEDTGSCVDFDLETCQVVGGIHHGEGSNCEDVICFPEGACCLPDGSCIGPVSPEDCVATGGAFQGDSTDCGSVSCPLPVGGCCGGDWCLDLTEVDCEAVAGQWSGVETLCDADPCSECPADVNGDGEVNVNDLLAIIAEWGASGGSSDVDGNGTVDVSDLLAVIAAWGGC